MVSTQTENRKRKKDYLYKSLDKIIDMIASKEIEKDRVNMAHFKKLLALVEEMSNMAFCIKRASEISTLNNEIRDFRDLPQQDDTKEDDFNEK